MNSHFLQILSCDLTGYHQGDLVPQRLDIRVFHVMV